MYFSRRRNTVVRLLILSIVLLLLIHQYLSVTRDDDPSLPIQHPSHQPVPHGPALPSPSVDADGGRFHWASVPQRHPVASTIPIPSSTPGSIPAIQHRFPREGADARRVRMARLDAVKGNFTHAWQGYKTHAWMSDEVAPLSGRASNPFGGWAATLVDALGQKLSTFVSKPHILDALLMSGGARYSVDHGTS